MQTKTNPWTAAGLVLAALVMSIFIGISSYKTKTQHIIELSEARFLKFDMIFEELVKSRLRSMGLACDVLLRSKEVVDAFENRDRKKLGSLIDDFFESVHKKHDIEQINFYTPPAKMFYRANHSELAQNDVSKIRKTVAAAIEKQERVMAVETGSGGVVGIRAIVPVIEDQKFYGVMEFVSSFHIPLENAAKRSKLSWGFSLTDEVWKNVGRQNDDKTDVAKGKDIYFDYSDSNTMTLIRDANFDPRATEYTIADAGDKKVFIHTIKVPNMFGVANITVAVVDDLTQRFDDARYGAALQFVILFVVLSILFVISYVKLDSIRSGMLGTFGAQRKKMEEQIELGREAMTKVKDLEAIKRHFFSVLISAVTEPLLAVCGQLKSTRQSLLDSKPNDASNSIDSALTEAQRLQQLVADYGQIELFRQQLVTGETSRVSIAESVLHLSKDIALYQRFPKFKVVTRVAEDLPSTRGQANLIEKALGNLLSYAASVSGDGEVIVTAEQDQEHWLRLSLSGSAFACAEKLTPASLNEAQQFLQQMDLGKASSGHSRHLVGLVMARLVFEHFGGTMDPGAEDAPGFIIRLPAAPH